MFNQEASALMEKFERYAKRAKQAIDAMVAVEPDDNLSEKENHFSDVLAHTSVACEALLSASKLIDDGRIRDKILQQRRTDPLLYWFWKARDVEVHHLLKKKLSAKYMEFEVLDPQAFQNACDRMAIPCDLEAPAKIAYGTTNKKKLIKRAEASFTVDHEALARAGLRRKSARSLIGLDTLRYHDDRKKQFIVIPEPKSHLSKFDPCVTDEAARNVLKYYRNHYYNLMTLGLANRTLTANTK